MAINATSLRIPVTVLGGYLGAGKTTLINQLLSQTGNPDPVRIAVLVNDFGTINLDAAFISSQSDSVIELSNGCICCSLADGFAAALDQIHQRALADPATAPQQLLIETSGVALPGAVAQYAHMPGFELASIIVMADGEQLQDQLGDRYIGETIRTQLGAADLVIVTKTDLISTANLETTTSLIRSLSPATIISAPPDSDLQLLVFGTRVVSPSSSSSAQASHQQPTLAIASNQVRLVQPVERVALERWLKAAPPSVARMKGVVEGENGLLRVDRVGPRVRIQVWPNQVAVSVLGTIAILSIKAHPGFDQTLSQWLGDSPPKL